VWRPPSTDGSSFYYDNTLDREISNKKAVFISGRSFKRAAWADGIRRRDLIVSRLALGDSITSISRFREFRGRRFPFRARIITSGAHTSRRRIPIYGRITGMIPKSKRTLRGGADRRIGAFTVGSIRQLFRPVRRRQGRQREKRASNREVRRRSRFQEGAIALEADLLARTPSGMEDLCPGWGSLSAGRRRFRPNRRLDSIPPNLAQSITREQLVKNAPPRRRPRVRGRIAPLLSGSNPPISGNLDFGYATLCASPGVAVPPFRRVDRRQLSPGFYFFEKPETTRHFLVYGRARSRTDHGQITRISPHGTPAARSVWSVSMNDR
jgi:hypothetical protein